MPTYEYSCSECGRFEAFQKITDDPLKACPTCGKEVRRLISANVNILFKGSGWYCVDNRKPNPAASTGDSSDGSSESKPAEAKDEKAS